MRLTEERLFLSFSGIRVHFHVVRPDVPVHSRVMLLASPMISAFHWRKLLPELAGLGCLAVLVHLGQSRGPPGEITWATWGNHVGPQEKS